MFMVFVIRMSSNRSIMRCMADCIIYSALC